jgi:hypothetical protein
MSVYTRDPFKHVQECGCFFKHKAKWEENPLTFLYLSK